MNFCSNCGSKNESKGKFCPSCGMQLSNIASTQENDNLGSLNEVSPKLSKEKKPNKNIFSYFYDTIFKETNVQTLTRFFYTLLLIDFTVAYLSRNIGIIIDPGFPTNPAYFLGVCVGLMAFSYLIINIFSIRYRFPLFTLGYAVLMAISYLLQLDESIVLGRASLLANTHGTAGGLMIFFDFFISGILEILVLLRIFIVLRK